MSLYSETLTEPTGQRSSGVQKKRRKRLGGGKGAFPNCTDPIIPKFRRDILRVTRILRRWLGYSELPRDKNSREEEINELRLCAVNVPCFWSWI